MQIVRRYRQIKKKDTLTKCPHISTGMVEMVLKSMLDEGLMRKVGSGRGAEYVRNDWSD